MDPDVPSLELKLENQGRDTRRHSPLPTIIVEEFEPLIGANNAQSTSNVDEWSQNNCTASNHDDDCSIYEMKQQTPFSDSSKSKEQPNSEVKKIFQIPRTNPQFQCDVLQCQDSGLLYCSLLNDENFKCDRLTVECRESSGNEKKEHLYKILVIGELGTGKTSIIKRYVHQFFSQHYRATIGVDFALKVISWDTDTLIRLQLWDIAGQERFGNMTRVYYKEAVGAFVVFDVTRVPTFEAVVKWKSDLDSKVQLPDGSNIPCVLLANKCDQTKEGLINNSDQMEEFCKDKGFLSWYETSAKENINIDEAARFLVSQILKNDASMQSGENEGDRDRILLNRDNQNEASSKKSCC